MTKRLILFLAIFSLLSMSIPSKVAAATYSINADASAISFHENGIISMEISKFNDSHTYLSTSSERSIGAVAVFIGGILAGYLVDGVLIYATGYSGGQLVSNALHSLMNAVGSFSNMNNAYFTTHTSLLNSFTTTNGNQCIVSASGTQFTCLFSIYK